MNVRWKAVVTGGATILSLKCYAQEGSEIGDAARGRTLAAKECAGCHRIGKASLRIGSPAAAPDFAAIANTSGITPTALYVFLTTSHPSMPNIMLTRNEISDVIAYILGLRRPLK